MTQAPAAREFDLFLREDESHFFWRLKNHGILVWGDGLSWEYEGQPRKRKFIDIFSVHLSSGHVARHGDIYTCQIRFRDGDLLTVQASTDMGLPDEARTAAYGEFVRTLHAQLATTGAKDISYRAGMSEGKRVFGYAVLVIATLLFVALPVGIFLFLESSFHVLFLVIAGAGLAWPIWKHMEKNTPREYSPDDLPYDLIPEG